MAVLWFALGVALGGVIGYALSARRCRPLLRELEELKREFEGMAEADDSSLKDSLVGVVSQLRRKLEELGRQVDEVRDVASRVLEKTSGRVRVLDDAVSTLRRVSEEISAKVEDTRQIAGQIDIAAADLAHSTEELSQAISRIEQSTHSAESGLKEVESGMSAQIRHIKEDSDRLRTLEEAITEIGGITTRIEDIAGKTKLLSLNASIEAARAGEAGRGFAVVADEIRKLAEQSKQAAEEVRQTIDHLIASVQNAYGRSRDRVEEVLRLEEVIRQSNSRIRAIMDAIQKVDGMSTDLAAVSEELSASVSQVSESAEGVVAVVNGLAEVINRLEALGEALRDVVIQIETIVRRLGS